MKVHIEIDCTPEEARTFMGLPDVGKANAVYVDMMSKAMKVFPTPINCRNMPSNWRRWGRLASNCSRALWKGPTRLAALPIHRARVMTEFFRQ